MNKEIIESANSLIGLIERCGACGNSDAVMAACRAAKDHYLIVKKEFQGAGEKDERLGVSHAVWPLKDGPVGAKLSVTVDTSDIQPMLNDLIASIEREREEHAKAIEYWKSQIGAPVSVETVQGEAVTWPPLDPLESAIQSTVTMIRDAQEDEHPSAVTVDRLGSHLNELLSLQLEKLRV